MVLRQVSIAFSPQGSLFNCHPHIHGLVLAGVIEEGIFYEQTNVSTGVIGEIFRARLLTVLQEQGIITQEEGSRLKVQGFKVE